MASSHCGIRKYTDEQRDKAVALAEKIGNERAAKELGIPTGTLGTWRSAYRKTLKLQRVQSSIAKQAPKAEAADKPQDNGVQPRESTSRRSASCSSSTTSPGTSPVSRCGTRIAQTPYSNASSLRLHVMEDRRVS